MFKVYFTLFLTFILFTYISFFTSCNKKNESKTITSSSNFKKDSLRVIELINKGNSIFAKRNKMSEIGESLIYFDSALKIANKYQNPFLTSRIHFLHGNVYNAWNQNPEKMIYHYQKGFDLFKNKNLGASKLNMYYVLAHAYDGEKTKDSLACIKLLKEVDDYLKLQPDSVKNQLEYLVEFAWISTNIKNYLFAEQFLKNHVSRMNIKNNPNSNDYLGHYYLTKLRIDIFGNKKKHSAYEDSILLAINKSQNNFDKQYYFDNLNKIYLFTNDYKKAYNYRERAIHLQDKISFDDIALQLKQNKLAKKLIETKFKKAEAEEKIKTRNFWLTISIICIFIILVLFRLYHVSKRKKQLRKEYNIQANFTKKLLETTEEERKRIGHDLHDSIGNSLVNLKQQIPDNLADSKTKIDEILDELRNISRNLHPIMFERIGLKITLEQFINRIQISHNFLITLEINYHSGLKSNEELQLYRIIQEGVNNMIKHSKALAGKITLIENEKSIELEIKDNGIGFQTSDITTIKNSFGLHSIYERSEAIGGKAEIQSNSNGTIIKINIQKTLS